MKHAELIARLEAAEAGNSELSLSVSLTAHGGNMDLSNANVFCTTSLDAALALAERVLPGCGVTLNRDEDISPGKWWAHVSIKSNDWVQWVPSSEQNTPALALCIAILRALDANN